MEVTLAELAQKLFSSPYHIYMMYRYVRRLKIFSRLLLSYLLNPPNSHPRSCTRVSTAGSGDGTQSVELHLFVPAWFRTDAIRQRRSQAHPLRHGGDKAIIAQFQWANWIGSKAALIWYLQMQDHTGCLLFMALIPRQIRVIEVKDIMRDFSPKQRLSKQVGK